MRNTKRFVFGIASSILFSVGLARAGETLDPIAQAVELTCLEGDPGGGPLTSTLSEMANQDK